VTAPRAGAKQRNAALVVVVVTAVAVLLLYARAPFAMQKLWAEDGRDFLGDAVRLGPIRSLGNDAQGGYYILGSRLGGVLASVLPLRGAAAALWLWVAGITAWLVATVTVCSRTWLRTWPSRLVLALALVMVPVLGVESIANAANLQVTMLFASLVVLISRPRSRIELVNGCAVLVATALTTTVAVALLPFAAARLVRHRQFRWDALAVSWVIGVALQWLAIAIGRPDPVTRDGAGFSSIMSRLWTAGLRDNLQPFDLPTGFAPVVALLFGALVTTAAWLAWKNAERLRAVWIVAVPLFGAGLFMLTASISGAHSRYMVTPALCFIWAVLAASETVAARVAESGRVTTTAIMTGIAAALVVAWLPRWTPSDERRSGPLWQDALEEAEYRCQGQPPDTPVLIQISPVSEQNPRQWNVLVQCDDL
jgi:hypothetical protein